VNADPMSCRELVELVTEYLEDALETTERARFEEHLRACDGCGTYLEQLRATVALTGRLREEDLARDLEGPLLAAFRHWRDGR
jgi:anti-sigma factor RsiW